MSPTIKTIQKTVAAHFGITTGDIIGGSRLRMHVRPRHIAMFLGRELTQRSFPDIGRRFKDRDHTTVMSAVDNIEYLMDKDPETKSIVKDLFTKITLENNPLFSSNETKHNCPNCGHSLSVNVGP